MSFCQRVILVARFAGKMKTVNVTELRAEPCVAYCRFTACSPEYMPELRQ